VLENVRVAVQGYARSFNFWSRADRLGTCATGRRHPGVVGLGAKIDMLGASSPARAPPRARLALASDPTLLLLDEPRGHEPEETDRRWR